MAQYNDQYYGQPPVNDRYGWVDPNQSGYAAPEQNSFGMDFQSFDYDQNKQSNPELFRKEDPYAGNMLRPGPPPPVYNSDFEDEPPLLEELGINPDHIVQKTLAVLNPLKETNPQILQDTDLSGPLAFCLMFGACLLLSGKVHFSYIYGIGVFGCLGMFFLLNLMANIGPSIGVTISVLGYCLLPMVGLSGLSIIFSLKGLLGALLSGVCVLWCALSASKLFVTALGMDKQQTLVAYPCALLYGVFALLTIF